MKKQLVLTFFLFVSYSLTAQKEWSNWYYSRSRSFTFKNGAIEKIQVPPNNSFYSFGNNSSDRASSYADANGNMRLIFNGAVYNSNYDTISNFNKINFCNIARPAATIVPFPGNPDKFYLLSLHSHSSFLLQASSGLQVRCPAPGFLNYNVVDLSANGGKGLVTEWNKNLLSQPIERLALVKHSSTNDTWIVSHIYGSNNFHSFRVTAAGILPGVISSVGPSFAGGWETALGFMVASPDGKKIAAHSGNYGANKFIELYNFDAESGTLSNYRTLTITDDVVTLSDAVFSPDNSKIYISATGKATNCTRNTGLIYQADFNAPDLQQSLTRIYTNKAPDGQYMFSNALDGKIYFTGNSTQVSTYSWQYSFDAIAFPNLPKQACIIKENFYSLGSSGNSYFPFPVYRTEIYNQAKEPILPVLNLGTVTSVCTDSITITAPVGYQSYKWNTGATGRTIRIIDSGTYYVTAGAQGFDKPEAFGTINVTTRGIPYRLPKDTILCPKSSVIYQLPSGYTNVIWQDGTTGNSYTLNAGGPSIGGPVKYTANDPAGCFVKDSVCVSFNQYPNPTLGNDTVLCNTSSLLLRPIASPYGGTAFLWQDGSVKDTFRVTKPGTYWVQAKYNTCTVRDTVVVNYVSGATVNLGNDTTVCQGDSLKLSLNIAGATYLWSDGSTAASFSLKNSGAFWVQVNNGACTVTDTIRVTFKPKPPLYLGADTSLCEMDKLLLNPSIAGASYVWNDQSTTGTFNVTQPGTYWVQATVSRCSVADTIKVSYRSKPSVDLGPDRGICKDSSITLIAYNPLIYSYNWSSGSNLPLLNVSRSGTYHVMVSGINGCSNSDTVLIAAKPSPSFAFSADTSLCFGQQLHININDSGAAILWQDGSISPQYNISSGGLYHVLVNINGCTIKDSIKVNFNPVPVVFLGNDTTICEGKTVTLNAGNPQNSYAWNDGSSLPFLKVAKQGQYSVKVTSNGCIAGDTINVLFQSLPKVNLGGDTTICLFDSLVLNVFFPGASYRWNNGSVSPGYTVYKAGLYTVQVSNFCADVSASKVVRMEPCETMFKYANAFSPNGDGINDTWQPEVVGKFSIFDLMVFNRYGQAVHHSNKPTPWRGTFNNKNLPVGVYYFIATYFDEYRKVKRRQSGSITLLK